MIPNRPARRPRRPRRHEEDDAQTALFSWFNVAKWRGVPLARFAFAVPNGSHLAGTPAQRAMQMARLKRMGLRVGFPDWGLVLPIPPYAGLFVEQKKAHGGRVTDEQRTWVRVLRRMGYDAHVCEGLDHSKRVVEAYVARSGFPLVIGYAPIDFDLGIHEEDE